MPVLALANQKGGTAKTTSTAHLGAALAEAGKRVLLGDLDPQGHLAAAFGIHPQELVREMSSVLLGRCSLVQARLEGIRVGLDLVPANLHLADLVYALASRPGRDLVLKKALEKVTGQYDWVLLDCPPSLGVLTLNAVVAADGILVPMNTEYSSMLGVADLLQMVEAVRSLVNPDIKIWGIIPTMLRRTVHSREVMEYVQRDLGSQGIRIYPAVPDSTRFKEAFALGKTVFETDPELPGAVAYRRIAKELIHAY